MKRRLLQAQEKTGAKPQLLDYEEKSSDLHSHDLLGLQSLIGNHAVQRLVAQTEPYIQRSPEPVAEAAPTAEPPELAARDYSTMSVDELRTQYKVLELMQLTATFILRPLLPKMQEEAEKVKQALVNKIVQEKIKTLLTEFQTISVFIPGTSETLPPETMGPPAPKSITFHAAYFINTETAKEHVKDAREASNFDKIVKEANATGEKSLITSGGAAYKAGSATKVGKATPENVHDVVQEALDNGNIRKYAINKGTLAATKQLSDLSESAAATTVQDWVIDNGVGVDCSGFVVQALVQARDAVRSELQDLGVPAEKLPGEISHEERKAKSFENETDVDKPTDLRPGDIWVMNNGAHVKIVTDARKSTNAAGEEVIEFDTAESAGGSTNTTVGPTAKSKKTKSLTEFGVGGSFHRM